MPNGNMEKKRSELDDESADRKVDSPFIQGQLYVREKEVWESRRLPLELLSPFQSPCEDLQSEIDREDNEEPDLEVEVVDLQPEVDVSLEEEVFSLPKDVLKRPNDSALRAQLKKIRTKEARALDAALASVGKRNEFEKALLAAIKAAPQPGENLNRYLIHLARLGAEAFILDVRIDGDKKFHIGLIDHPSRLSAGLTAPAKEHFLYFAVKRLLEASSSALKPERHRLQLDRAIALFRMFQAELAREYRLVISSQELLLAYRSLLARIIWKHYQALMDQLLAEAESSKRSFSSAMKELENNLQTAALTRLHDKEALVPAFHINFKSKIVRDYFTPTSQTDLGFTYFSSRARPAEGDGHTISFQAALRRRAEQKRFLEQLEKRSHPDLTPKLHSSASWQGWVRKMIDRPAKLQVDKLKETLGWVSAYFEAFTAHVPYDLREGCKEKNYLARSYPRAVTGALIHDCFSYAARWLHILGRVFSPGSAPSSVSNPRISLIELPSHVAVMIRADIRGEGQILVSINNKQVVVETIGKDEKDQAVAELVVDDMYQGMMTPYFIRPIKSRISDAAALWKELCLISAKKLRLPYSDPSEPHLRYLAYNAGIARVARELADAVGILWFELNQKLDAAKKESKEDFKKQFRDDVQQYCRSIEKAVKTATGEYEKTVKPLIAEINADLRANLHQLPKGTLVVKDSPPSIPWEDAWDIYRLKFEKALKSLDRTEINPEGVFRDNDFRASVN